MNDLEELKEIKRILENKIENFFNRTGTRYTGDQGYQDLLCELDKIEEQIDEIENEN